MCWPDWDGWIVNPGGEEARAVKVWILSMLLRVGIWQRLNVGIANVREIKWELLCVL